VGGGIAFAAAAVFLLANLAAHGQALVAAFGGEWGSVFLSGVVLGLGALLARPSLLGLALELCAASFFLYGFHSYRAPSQVLGLLVAAFALVLVLRSARATADSAAPTAPWPFRLLVLYALLAAASLLLLPMPVLEHRLFLEGGDFGRAVLEAFPKDPLYPIASVNRLWLFVLFSSLLSAQGDARSLYRRLFRGVAWAAVAAVVLGLLDFAGLVSLDRYNLSNLFYGKHYRRLQSTFGNPSWFACFVACALPFVLLRFHEARGRARWAMAVVFPMCGAAVFLSAARAAWLASLVLLAAVVAAAFLARRRGQSLETMDAPAWLALGATVVTVGLLGAAAVTTPTDRVAAPGGHVGRLEGLTREMQYRGLRLDSPRHVAAAYARELTRLAPLSGLGYESFNMHLRAQLEVPGSGVAGVANTAVAADPMETVFDDSHNTYLQVLTGTGALGLVVWLATGVAGLLAAARAFRRGPGPDALALLLGLVVFHFYGLFQGMAYVPVTFLLFPLFTGYAVALDPRPVGAPATRGARIARLAVTGGVLVAALGGYAADTGYASLKRRLGVEAYLPDERAAFEGFYRAEIGPEGEFRWMRRRAIVNVPRAQPFRLRLACQHPDAAEDPVVLSLRFEGRDAGHVVFRRTGAVERRFDFGGPGTLRLSVSRTFRPAGDSRELGVAVSAIQWE
jgi:hypothetical protein